MCGIPAVTLLGTQQDWINLRTRLDKLLEFGSEREHPNLHAWHSLLSPTITHFVNAFDAFSPYATATVASAQKVRTQPSSNQTLAVAKRAQEIRDFFQRICHKSGGGSGPRYVSGWITFFCAFDEHGKWQLQHADAASTESDGSWYGWNPKVNMNDIPPAYGQVDVQLNDNGELVDTVMIAGVVGFKVLGDGENRNTLTPYSGWWMFTLDEERERELKEEAEQQAEWQRQWQMRMMGDVKPRDTAERGSKKKKEKVQADGRA